MIRTFFNLLFKLKKWQLQPGCPKEAKNCIMIAAPHTSNWDFVYAMVALKKLGLNPRFTIKREFNKPLIGAWIQGLGGLWIDRTPKKEGEKRLSMTQVMSNLFKDSDEPLTVLVTAEGTRSRTTEWKTGFYYAAVEANVPICLAFMDYKRRITGVGTCFIPSGNIKSDMKVIMDFYSDKSPKHPSKFALDIRYT